jgi:hypothetical protein
MLRSWVRLCGQQVDQELAGFAGKTDGERDLARLLVEIMHEGPLLP